MRDRTWSRYSSYNLGQPQNYRMIISLDTIRNFTTYRFSPLVLWSIAWISAVCTFLIHLLEYYHMLQATAIMLQGWSALRYLFKLTYSSFVNCMASITSSIPFNKPFFKPVPHLMLLPHYLLVNWWSRVRIWGVASWSPGIGRTSWRDAL